MAGILYLVPTPIGNLGDISRRMAETLAEVKKAAIDGAEATRGMEAVKGRASYQTNKGVGHLDAGAVTMSYQIECLCDYIAANLI